MVTALERTFGFELEVDDAAADVALALYGRRLTRGDHRHDWHCSCDYCNEYFGDQHNWFKTQRDSSCGGEIISSPLMWGWTGGPRDGPEVDPGYLIDQLCEVLVEQDTPITSRCGLHVHVGALDLSDEALGRLYQLMHHHEAILYRLACGRSPTHRGYENEFNYCRPMSAFTNPVEAQELAKLKSTKVKSSPIAYNKYVMANMVPIEGLGTVELRLWESTRSRRRLRLYTKLSVALVQRAKRRRRPVGPMLELGAQADDGVLLDFLADLQRSAPELVDDQFMEDALWQWGEAPAGWQAAVTLPPLPHFLPDGRQATTADDVPLVMNQSDGHGRMVEVPWRYQEEEQETSEGEMPEPDVTFTTTETPDTVYPIPEEHRSNRFSSPNYDCGRVFCGHDHCRNNRTDYRTRQRAANYPYPPAEPDHYIIRDVN